MVTLAPNSREVCYEYESASSVAPKIHLVESEKSLSTQTVVGTHFLGSAKSPASPQILNRPIRDNFAINPRRMVDRLKQSWVGTVQKVLDGEIVAILEDKINRENPELQVSIPMAEVLPSDLPLVTKGAVFYWHIGYIEGLRVSRTTFSKIRFRRLAERSQEEMEEASKEAERYAAIFAGN